MKFRRFSTTTLIAAIFCIGTAFANASEWMTDFEAAKKKATEEKKLLIINFTGSDWCGYCIKLKKDVFSQDEFYQGVKDKYILVELDFPKKPENVAKIPADIAAQNEVLKKKYAINGGFPTVYLADAQGKPFAKTGYIPIGPKTYLKHLNILVATREMSEAAIAEAKDKEGEDKAKTMLFAIGTMDLNDELIATFYSDEIEAIKANSPEFAKKMEQQKAIVEFQNQLNALAAKNDQEGMVKFIDETLATGTYDGEVKQQIMIFKSMSLNKLQRTEEALKTLDEAKAISPKGKLSAQIDSIKKRIEAGNSKE